MEWGGKLCANSSYPITPGRGNSRYRNSRRVGDYLVVSGGDRDAKMGNIKYVLPGSIADVGGVRSASVPFPRFRGDRDSILISPAPSDHKKHHLPPLATSVQCPIPRGWVYLAHV